MASSRTAIANRALTKLGSARISDLIDDTPQARAVNSMYDMVRRAVLRGYRWSFAMSRASLAAMSSAPEWGYAYQYQLPATCQRLDMVGELYHFPIIRQYVSGPSQPWLVEGRRILTDLPAPLKIRFVDDVEEGEAAFDETLACKLAIELCEPLTQGGAQKRELLIEEFKDTLKEARRVNAIELPPDPVPDDAWIMGRL